MFHTGVSCDVCECDYSHSLVCDVLFFFFFQAEDGIRDDLVTGVQTCALPISQRKPGSIKSGALPQQEMGSIKSRGAAAMRIGKYKKRGRCSNEKWAV